MKQNSGNVEHRVTDQVIYYNKQNVQTAWFNCCREVPFSKTSLIYDLYN